MRIKKLVGMFIWSIILLFLLVDFTFARGSKFPDPLEILKNLPPPTIDHDYKSSPGRFPDAKPPLNPETIKNDPKTGTKKPGDFTASGTANSLQGKDSLASGSASEYRLVIDGSSPLALTVPSAPVTLASNSGGSGLATLTVGSPKGVVSAEVASAPPPKVLTASPPVKVKEVKASEAAPLAEMNKVTASGTDQASSKKTGKKDKDKLPDQIQTAKATETKLYSETASGTASSAAQTPANATSTASGAETASPTQTASASVATASGTAPPEGGTPASEPAGVSGEIIANAEKLLKEQKWKDLNQFLNDNPALGDNDRGAQIRIVCAMNQPKVIATKVKDLSEALLGKKPDDPYANFGMAYYYLEGKKPDPGKALACLAKAKSGKDVPAGVSGLYWKAFMKKYWIFLLVLLGGAVAGGNEIKKKIKAKKAAAVSPESPAESTPPAAAPETAVAALPEGVPPIEEKGWKKVLGKIKEKLKEIGGKVLAKLKKKKPAGEQAPVAEAEVAEGEASADVATEAAPTSEETSGSGETPPPEGAPSEPSPDSPPAETADAAAPNPDEEGKT